MGNGKGKIEITYNSDGSEVHDYFDENGDHIASAYRSDAYATHLANGGSLDSYEKNAQSGGGVKGLTVVYHSEVQPGDYGDLMAGVVLDLKYTGSHTKGDWIQIITTDKPSAGRTSPYFDVDEHAVLPYYPAQEYDKETDTKRFYDRPGRLPRDGNASWSAQLLLYDNRKVIFSISYGFDLINGVSTAKPLIIKNIRP